MTLNLNHAPTHRMVRVLPFTAAELDAHPDGARIWAAIVAAVEHETPSESPVTIASFVARLRMMDSAPAARAGEIRSDAGAPTEKTT